MDRKSWSKKGYTGKSSKSENREDREIAEVQHNSAVELEIEDDDVNKENKIGEEKKGYKISFKNTKLPVTNEDLEDITNKRML